MSPPPLRRRNRLVRHRNRSSRRWGRTFEHAGLLAYFVYAEHRHDSCIFQSARDVFLFDGARALVWRDSPSVLVFFRFGDRCLDGPVSLHLGFFYLLGLLQLLAFVWIELLSAALPFVTNFSIGIRSVSAF